MSTRQVLKNIAKLDAISFPKPNPLGYTAAVRLPEKVTSISLIFKKYNKGGHMGIRKFWKEYLPSVKFYNPDVAINVKRISLSAGETDKEKIKQLENDMKLIKQCPATITVEYQDLQTPKVVLDCIGKHSNDILKEFVESTKAEPVPPQELIKFTELQKTLV